jgi:endonuclease/exonuclease/phosphatase family metal-dependent hydrolase
MANADQITEDAPVNQIVSIGTWNMDHWKRTAEQRLEGWAFLKDSARADVMLLQESSSPRHLSREHFVHREIGGNRPWGSAVVSFADEAIVTEIDTVRTRYAATRFSMLGTHPGAVIVAHVDLPSIGPLTCVSVYGLINVYAQTTMLRIVADLIPLFDSRYGDRVILGGDFNVSTSTNPDNPELPRYKAIHQAVESLGLVNLLTLDIQKPPRITNCVCDDPECCHVQTYGHNPGVQLDWLYATPELARMCTRVRLERDIVGHLSDHSPIIADFCVTPRDKVEVLDPDSFLESLGAKDCSDSVRVAEALIAWALRKHQTLAVCGFQTASLDRLPTGMSGNRAQLWVQLDIRNPESLQYTFSLSSDGRVVIQFQYMTAPFDTTEAREKLWLRISEIDGVSLEKRLNGRPSFSIKSLVRTDRREQFERIFSDVVDETLQARKK